jgi:hypothetical protein
MKQETNCVKFADEESLRIWDRQQCIAIMPAVLEDSCFWVINMRDREQNHFVMINTKFSCMR